MINGLINADWLSEFSDLMEGKLTTRLLIIKNYTLLKPYMESLTIKCNQISANYAIPSQLLRVVIKK